MKRTYAYRDGKIVEITGSEKGWCCTETIAILDIHSTGQRSVHKPADPIFLKARHKFSHGPSEWEYFEIYLEYYSQDQKEALRDWVVEFCAKYDYSEHYRGCDYEIVPMPPRSWLKDRIRQLQSACTAYQATIIRYQGMLELQ